MRGGCADGHYVRFLEATIGLADASTALVGQARFGMAVAILRVCESERVARAALVEAEPHGLERAAARLRLARSTLEEAGRDAAVDARRRRSLSLVA